MNGLVLDLYPTSRGRALNLLHLFFSLGALASPLFVGRLVEAGMAWQSVLLGTAFAAVPLAVLFARRRLPSGRHAHARKAAARPDRACLAAGRAGGRDRLLCRVGDRRLQLARPLPRGGVGQARDLGPRPVLGLPRAGPPGQRAVGDRFDHAWFAAAAALIAAIALVAASLVPSLPASIVLFGVVGFAFGPVYPLIMAVAGDRFPTRSAAVSGFLAGIAVIGAIFYPPIMGFVSVGVGLQAAMLGAAALALVCAVVLLLARSAVAER